MTAVSWNLHNIYSVLWELFGVSGSLGRAIALIDVSLASCLLEFFLLFWNVFLLVLYAFNFRAPSLAIPRLLQQGPFRPVVV